MTDSDTPKMLFLVSAVIAVAAVGCACLFRTTALVEWARRDYQRSSRFVQGWPGAKVVLMPWFPAYLRLLGAFLLLIAVLVSFDVWLNWR